MDNVESIQTAKEQPKAASPISEPRNKGGRPKGFNGLRSKMPSAMAIRFKQAGLEWQTDFALAIKAAGDRSLSPSQQARARERIKLWLRLLPYLVATSSRAKVKTWKGRPSKAALIALEAMEQDV